MSPAAFVGMGVVALGLIALTVGILLFVRRKKSESSTGLVDDAEDEERSVLAHPTC
jgi:hypothetical protein